MDDIFVLLSFSIRFSDNEKGGIAMGRSNKSKRFVQHGKNAVQLHDQQFPYHMTLEQSEQRKAKQAEQNSLGGI